MAGRAFFRRVGELALTPLRRKVQVPKADVVPEGRIVDLPAIAAAVPDVPELLAPLKPAASNLKAALGGSATLLSPLTTLLDGGAASDTRMRSPLSRGSRFDCSTGGDCPQGSTREVVVTRGDPS